MAAAVKVRAMPNLGIAAPAARSFHQSQKRAEA
jgi:hypothetical protein